MVTAMAITKPKKLTHDAERPRGVKKGNKRQISLNIAPALLQRVDELAAELGQSHAALITIAVYRAVEHGLIIDGLRKDSSTKL